MSHKISAEEYRKYYWMAAIIHSGVSGYFLEAIMAYYWYCNVNNSFMINGGLRPQARRHSDLFALERSSPNRKINALIGFGGNVFVHVQFYNREVFKNFHLDNTFVQLKLFSSKVSPVYWISKNRNGMSKRSSNFNRSNLVQVVSHWYKEI